MHILPWCCCSRTQHKQWHSAGGCFTAGMLACIGFASTPAQQGMAWHLHTYPCSPHARIPTTLEALPACSLRAPMRAPMKAPAVDWCLHAPPQSKLHHPCAFVPVLTLLHRADPTPVLTLSRRCWRGPAQATAAMPCWLLLHSRACTVLVVLPPFHPTTLPCCPSTLPPPPPINICVHPCTDIPSLCRPSAIL